MSVETIVPEDELLLTAIHYAATMNCEQGSKIILPGDTSQVFYFVEKGSIEVSYMQEKTRITVALIGAGNFFGEIGFFDGGSRVRDIQAIEDSSLRVFTLEGMDNFQQNAPLAYSRFLVFLTQSICSKFRRILEEREPLQAYAASLATGKGSYTDSTLLPQEFLNSSTWKTVSSAVDGFTSKLYNITHELQTRPTEEIDESMREKTFSVLDSFYQQTLYLQELDISEEEADYTWGYAFKELFPYFMRSRFAERIYFKPKGYAGDFLMMEMIYKKEPEGDGKIGKLIDEWCLNFNGAKAILGRRKLLCSQLHEVCSTKFIKNKKINILNLACGPNRELFDFLLECDYSEKIEALCVDIDSEALQYTNTHVNVFPHSASIRLMSENIIKWALGRSQQGIGMQDIIYSAGLTDYLVDKLFIRFAQCCYDHLKPGGIFIVGNFAPNSDQTFMDNILHWKLIYRDIKNLQQLMLKTDFGKNVEILSEPQGINLFVKAYKTDTLENQTA